MEDFVTYEQAVKLKELGFDWKCNHFYDIDGEFAENIKESPLSEFSNYEDHNNDKDWPNIYSAPSLAQSQKWLREEKHLLITIERDKESGKFGWVIYRNDSLWKSDIVCNMNGYHVLQLTAIDKALELLKQQSK